MDALLVALPRNEGSMFDDRSEALGIGYLAAVLRQHHYEVEILDCCIEDLTADVAAREILRRDFRMLGLGRFDVGSFETARMIIDRLRGEGVRAHICTGGHLATLQHDLVLSEFPGLDTIVRGEGEETILDLMGRLSQGLEWRNVPGLAFRANDTTVSTAMRPLLCYLDALPFPARDMLPKSKQAIGQAAIYSSRGCKGACSFCSVRSFYRLSRGPRWRGRSPENVVAEIEALVTHYGVNYIVFNDDNFLDDPLRARQIARLLIRKALPVHFSIMSRADCVSREVLADLKEAGLHTLGLGVESGHQAGLDFLGKGITVAQNRQALAMASDLGLISRVGFIMFGPKTTIEELREDFRFLAEIEQVSPLLFLRSLGVDSGTAMQKRLQKEGLLSLPGIQCQYRFADPRVEVAFRVMTESCRWLVPLFVKIWNLDGQLRLGVNARGAIDLPLLDIIKQQANANALAFALEILDYAEAHAHDPLDCHFDMIARMRSRVQEYDLEMRTLLALG